MSEMCELQRTMDNEMKLQEFLGVKGQYREMGDLNAKRAAEKKAKMEEKQDKIENYKNILQLIKEFTGICVFFIFHIYRDTTRNIILKYIYILVLIL